MPIHDRHIHRIQLENGNVWECRIFCFDDKYVAGVTCKMGEYDSLGETEEWVRSILVSMMPIDKPFFIFRPDNFVFEVKVEGNKGDLFPRPDLSPMKLLFNYP